MSKYEPVHSKRYSPRRCDCSLMSRSESGWMLSSHHHSPNCKVSAPSALFLFFFFLNDPPPTETSTFPLHAALPLPPGGGSGGEDGGSCGPAVSCSSPARSGEAAAALRRDPKLALNLLLDKPAKLLEKLPQGLSTPPATSTPGDRGASSSRSRRSPPRLSPAG